MEKRLKNYLNYIDGKTGEPLPAEARTALKSELLIQIGFFQHERLVHLLVTLGFGIMTILTFLFSLQYQIPMLYVLLLVFLVLFIPYIRHYYILENGVQKLYKYYDKLNSQSSSELNKQEQSEPSGFRQDIS